MAFGDDAVKAPRSHFLEWEVSHAHRLLLRVVHETIGTPRGPWRMFPQENGLCLTDEKQLGASKSGGDAGAASTQPANRKQRNGKTSCCTTRALVGTCTLMGCAFQDHGALFVPTVNWSRQGVFQTLMEAVPLAHTGRWRRRQGYRNASVFHVQRNRRCRAALGGVQHLLSTTGPEANRQENPSTQTRGVAGAASPFEQAPVTTVGRPLSVAELKQELLVSVTDVNRGLASTSSNRRAILNIIRALERTASTEAGSGSLVSPSATLDWTASSAKVTGKWRLLFTTALDVILLGCSFPPFTPQIGSIYQNIRMDSSTKAASFIVENVVNFAVPGSFLLARLGMEDTTATLRVYANGTCDASRPKRLYLRFERARLEPNLLLGNEVQDRLPPLDIPLRGTAVGWTELTFLDDNLRIFRTAVDDVFVLWRD